MRQEVAEMKQALQESIVSYQIPLPIWSISGRQSDNLGNAYYLDRQAESESNARSYPRKLPIAIRRAKGIFVEDTDGRCYIDCLAGAGALALGHCHPIVVEAVQNAIADGVPWQTLDLTTPVKDAFVQELFESLPREFAESARIQFCGPSGADAIEAALKLVKTATGRRSILTFHGAYHGMTHGALGLTGETGPKLAVAGLMPEVHFLPFPYIYRCPFNLGGDAGSLASAHYIESVLDDTNSGITPPAAMILEVIQGEGGVIVSPNHWLREIRRITRERKIPLIIDEVQTGLGRTGRMFAFEHAGILPDVLVLSKAVGGGLPLSVVLYHKDLDCWGPGAHAGTFRGNQLAMAAGAATIRFIREHGLDRHAALMGERLMALLNQLKEEASCIGDVRGKGLMIGVEIVDPERKSGCTMGPAYDPEMAQRIQRECLRRGLILELGGRRGCVARLLPPLVLTLEQVTEIASIFADAVSASQR